MPEKENIMGKDLRGKNLGKGYSQRKDGRYEARAVINGVKIDLYDMSINRLKRTFEAEKLRVLEMGMKHLPVMTLSEWYEEWFTKCKSPSLKSENSRRTYDRKVRNTYIKILGTKKMNLISQMDLQIATNELVDEGRYNRRGITESLHAVRECFDVAVANKMVSTNPVVGIHVKDTNEIVKERRVLEHWEQDVFLEEVKGSYYYEAYMVLLLTGMRIGEFSGLQWEDIDFVNKRIRVQRSMSTCYVNGKKIEELTTPKTFNSYRDIPFFGDIEKHLLNWKQKQDYYKDKVGARWRADKKLGDLVFTTTMGSPVTRYNIVHDLKRVEDNIRNKEKISAVKDGRPPRQFGHLYPHAFRHTFATRCFEKGLDPVVVQSIMGHSNYSTTISYTHVLSDKFNEAVRMAGGLLA